MENKKRVVIAGLGKLGTVLRKELKGSMGNNLKIIKVEKASESAITGANIVFLSLPSKSVIKVLGQMKEWLETGCVVSNLGKTRQDIIGKAKNLLGEKASFLDSYPLVDLKKTSSLKGQYWCLSAPLQTPNEQVLRQLIVGMGAHIIIIHPQIHDYLVE